MSDSPGDFPPPQGAFPPPPPMPNGYSNNGQTSDKEWVVAVILTWLLGTLGIDRFYLGYTGLGILN